MVPELFSKENDWEIYYKLIEEIRELQESGEKNAEFIGWHEGSHLISKGPQKSATFDSICKKLCTYFNIDPKKYGTRFNWYRDSSDWKPFHHDSAAFNPQRAQSQNITVGVSFGATRELAFYSAAPLQESGGEKVKIYFPQTNGMVFSFGRDANIKWKHGINALSPDEQTGKGRVSIILWGLAKDAIEEENSPAMLGSDGVGPHAASSRDNNNNNNNNNRGGGGGGGGGNNGNNNSNNRRNNNNGNGNGNGNNNRRDNGNNGPRNGGTSNNNNNSSNNDTNNGNGNGNGNGGASSERKNNGNNKRLRELTTPNNIGSSNDNGSSGNTATASAASASTNDGGSGRQQAQQQQQRSSQQHQQSNNNNNTNNKKKRNRGGDNSRHKRNEERSHLSNDTGGFGGGGGGKLVDAALSATRD
jgi:hypothetical protein